MILITVVATPFDELWLLIDDCFVVWQWNRWFLFLLVADYGGRENRRDCLFCNCIFFYSIRDIFQTNVLEFRFHCIKESSCRNNELIKHAEQFIYSYQSTITIPQKWRDRFIMSTCFCRFCSSVLLESVLTIFALGRGMAFSWVRFLPQTNSWIGSDDFCGLETTEHGILWKGMATWEIGQERNIATPFRDCDVQWDGGKGWSTNTPT